MHARTQAHKNTRVLTLVHTKGLDRWTIFQLTNVDLLFETATAELTNALENSVLSSTKYCLWQ